MFNRTRLSAFKVAEGIVHRKPCVFFRFCLLWKPSFKLELIDLAIFPDLNLKLLKLRLLQQYVYENFRVSTVIFFFPMLSSSKVTCFYFVHFPWNKIILRENCEDKVQKLWYYSSENSRMDQVNLCKTAFIKFYFVYSWILCFISIFIRIYFRLF